jgi:hypothetical protein
MAIGKKFEPQPRSGKQEQIENLRMRSIYTDKI